MVRSSPDKNLSGAVVLAGNVVLCVEVILGGQKLPNHALESLVRTLSVGCPEEDGIGISCIDSMVAVGSDVLVVVPDGYPVGVGGGPQLLVGHSPPVDVCAGQDCHS